MSRRPTRATAGGRAYLELRKLAQERHRPTAEFLQLYALEGFLVRLPLSADAHRFVLKGGVLLAAFDARRPTKDIDLAATGLRNHPETVRAAIQSVLELGIDDGLEFDLSTMEARVIREGEDYSGVRVTVPCLLASANLDFHIDVNIGDPISPAPATVSIPRILGGDPIRVTGYPIAMILAEKIVTAIQRGTANTRWRDFADITVLSRHHTLESTDLRPAIQAVAQHRLAGIQPLRIVLAGFGDAAQREWAAWRRRLQMEDQLPASFTAILEELIVFVDPLLRSGGTDATWNPSTRAWE